jgi:hypothetical protein
MSIVGIWQITVNTPMGAQQASLELRADGTGTTSSPLGSSPIRDVRVDGDRATFAVDIEMMGQKFTLAGSASASGDAITGKYESAMGASEFSGKRSA